MKPTPQIAIARPRWWNGKISHRIACESGMMGPPPRPWKMRATISVVRLGAMPERNELATNSVEQMRKKRLRPNNPASQPVAGMTTAFAARYDVITHDTSSSPADIVEAVGPQGGEFKPGDHVIACLSVFCGACDYCLTGKTHLCQTRPARKKDEPPKLTWNGQPVNQFANLSAYAEKMLVHENALVKIEDQMRLAHAARIGCGVTTGVGAVLNTARIEPGSTVAVFGAGGVGLATIQGARIAGARMIIAVDTMESKFAKAK